MNKLRYLRAQAGLTLEELADQSGVNRDTISRIENGRKARSLTFGKLAKVLGVDLLDFGELISDDRGPKQEAA